MARESTVGVLLLLCAVLSIMLANSSVGDGYRQLWSRSVGGHPISHWIDDGLMAVFFLLVGLELKHEFLYGSLRSPKQALVPMLAAVGGMVMPAAVFLALNHGESTWRGFGIPMATDIAFVLAVLALLGSRVPAALKVFLTTLAVVDDLGAILVIALFYSSTIDIPYLMLAFVAWWLLCLTGWTAYPRRRSEAVMLTAFLIAGGVGLWVLLMRSGVHATLSGIMLAVAVPSFDNLPKAPASRWQERLHRPVYWVVLPLFILANTAISFASFGGGMPSLPLVGGIVVGLLLGKPLGILLGTWAALRIGGGGHWDGIGLGQWVGAACLGGIGFTMAIFVTSLAFDDLLLVDSAKAAILMASVVAALIGAILLARSKKKQKQSIKTSITMKKYICDPCGWEYDPAVGVPELGIAPGTPFEALPDTFVCPLCGASKEHFSEE